MSRFETSHEGDQAEDKFTSSGSINNSEGLTKAASMPYLAAQTSTVQTTTTHPTAAVQLSLHEQQKSVAAAKNTHKNMGSSAENVSPDSDRPRPRTTYFSDIRERVFGGHQSQLQKQPLSQSQQLLPPPSQQPLSQSQTSQSNRNQQPQGGVVDPQQSQQTQQPKQPLTIQEQFNQHRTVQPDKPPVKTLSPEDRDDSRKESGVNADEQILKQVPEKRNSDTGVLEQNDPMAMRSASSQGGSLSQQLLQRKIQKQKYQQSSSDSDSQMSSQLQQRQQQLEQQQREQQAAHQTAHQQQMKDQLLHQQRQQQELQQRKEGQLKEQQTQQQRQEQLVKLREQQKQELLREQQKQEQLLKLREQQLKEQMLKQQQELTQKKIELELKEKESEQQRKQQQFQQLQLQKEDQQKEQQLKQQRQQQQQDAKISEQVLFQRQKHQQIQEQQQIKEQRMKQHQQQQQLLEQRKKELLQQRQIQQQNEVIQKTLIVAQQQQKQFQSVNSLPAAVLPPKAELTMEQQIDQQEQELLAKIADLQHRKELLQQQKELLQLNPQSQPTGTVSNEPRTTQPIADVNRSTAAATRLAYPPPVIQAGVTLTQKQLPAVTKAGVNSNQKPLAATVSRLDWAKQKFNSSSQPGDVISLPSTDFRQEINTPSGVVSASVRIPATNGVSLVANAALVLSSSSLSGGTQRSPPLIAVVAGQPKIAPDTYEPTRGVPAAIWATTQSTQSIMPMQSTVTYEPISDRSTIPSTTVSKTSAPPTSIMMSSVARSVTQFTSLMQGPSNTQFPAISVTSGVSKSLPPATSAQPAIATSFTESTQSAHSATFATAANGRTVLPATVVSSAVSLMASPVTAVTLEVPKAFSPATSRMTPITITSHDISVSSSASPSTSAVAKTSAIAAVPSVTVPQSMRPIQDQAVIEHSPLSSMVPQLTSAQAMFINTQPVSNEGVSSFTQSRNQSNSATITGNNC